MSTSAIKAGQAFYEIFATDKTEKGIKEAEKNLRSFAGVATKIGAAITTFAAAGVAGIAMAASRFSEFGSMINDFSARTGVSTEWAQVFKASAELAGASMGNVEAAIRKMQKTLGKTGKLSGMSPEQQFIAVADALLAIEDPTLRAAKAQEIFGKSGTMLLPMLASLRDNYKFFQSNGLLLSPEDIKNADELGDAWDMMKMSLMQVVRIAGASLAPAITYVAKAITSATAAVATFAQNNKGLFSILTGLSVAVVAVAAVVGPMLLALGGGLSFIMATLAAWPSIVAVASAAFGVLGAVFAAAVSPVGLIVIAVAALVALLPALAYVLDQAIAGGAGLKFLSDAFAELYNIASSAIGGILDAIANGNWSLAAAIAGAALNTAFVTAWGWIKMGFSDFGTWLLNYLTDLFGSQVVGIVLKGMKAIIDTINSAAATFGIDTGLDSSGLDTLIKSSGDSNEFKKELDARNKAYKASVQKDIDAAKGEQKLLEDIAAEGRKAKEQGPKTGNLRLGDLSTGTAITENKAIQSLGAISAASAGRVGQNIPQFDDMKKIAEDSKDLLAKIEENTADGGDEFGD